MGLDDLAGKVCRCSGFRRGTDAVGRSGAECVAPEMRDRVGAGAQDDAAVADAEQGDSPVESPGKTYRFIGARYRSWTQVLALVLDTAIEIARADTASSSVEPAPVLSAARIRVSAAAGSGSTPETTSMRAARLTL